MKIRHQKLELTPSKWYSIILLLCTSEKYKRSFFPSATTLWNQQSSYLKSATPISVYKKILAENRIPKKPPLYFKCGNRYLSALHTRLHLNHANLNDHLFKIGLAESPACQCGHPRETVCHYLLECSLYRQSRDLLLSKLDPILAPHFYIRYLIQNKMHILRLMYCCLGYLIWVTLRMCLSLNT